MNRTALFWVIMQRAVVISYQCFGQPTGPIFKGQESNKKAGCPNTVYIWKSVGGDMLSAVWCQPSIDASGWEEGGV
jgi:hypothetical protein